MNRPLLLIRPSEPADVPTITEIYAWNVQQGTGSFEVDAPDPAEISRRRDEVLARGWPWLVVERDGVVLGFAFANRFRPRHAYRFCVEDSIYLAANATGQGLSHWLLAELMVRCEAAGARQMLAVIGDSRNVASIALHRRLGFEHTGVIRDGGWKFNRWLDIVFMQKNLGPGALRAPEDGA